MGRGKEIAQGSHASMAFLTKCLKHKENGESFFEHELSWAEIEWLKTSFKKITLQVQTESELIELNKAAKAAGLESN